MSANDSQCYTNLSNSGVALIGLTLITEAGLLSMFAVTILVCIITYNVYNGRRKQAKRWKLFRTPYHVWILFLLAFDFIQGLGTSLNIKWLVNEAVSCSDFCTAQGTISAIGASGSAMVTLMLTFYTYISIIRRKSMKNLAWAWATSGLIALYTVLFSVIGAALHHSGNDSFQAPEPYWCWLSATFNKERIPYEYLWLWLAALSSFIYIPLWFFVQSSEEGLWKLLLYPIAYTILVLPTSIVRWSFFKGHTPSPLTQLLLTALYRLTGLVNVILLVYIRQTTKLFLDEDEDGGDSKDFLPSTHAPVAPDDQMQEIQPIDIPGAGLPE